MAAQAFKLLSTGRPMPGLGFGTYQFLGEAATEAVDCALAVGYRHIDAAAVYDNEEHVGEALYQRLKTGKMKRKDLFVTTKIPCYALGKACDMKRAFERSLDELKLTQVDMVLLHAPWAYDALPGGTRKVAKNDVNENWGVLESFFKDGRALGIGLSNFSIRLMEKVMGKCRVKPHNLQLECHAYLQQNALRAFCQKQSVVITGYSPLGAPARPHSLGEPILLDDPTVKHIAETTGRTCGQVLLQYVVHLGAVPLVKATNPQRIEENFKALDNELRGEHCASLLNLERGVKYYPMLWAQRHPEYCAGEER